MCLRPEVCHDPRRLLHRDIYEAVAAELGSSLKSCRCNTQELFISDELPGAASRETAGPMGKGSRKGTPNQEQEPEQERTTSDFNSTEAAQYVCQELDLAGTGMRWLVRDVIDGELKKSAGAITAIAEAMGLIFKFSIQSPRIIGPDVHYAVDTREG